MTLNQAELQFSPEDLSGSTKIDIPKFSFDYTSEQFRSSLLLHADCMEWLSRCPKDSIHAVVTDPPVWR